MARCLGRVPQWHSLAAILLAEAYRQSDDAARSNTSGIELASRANYCYALRLGAQIAERIAHDRAATPPIR